MTLHPPRYSLPPPPLLPHAARVNVVLWTTFREKLGGLNIALLILTFVVVLPEIIVPFYLLSLIGNGTSSPLALFALPYDSGAWFFFEVLFTASVGAGVVANDLSTRAITMYLARPITTFDYLSAKVSAVALWIGIVAILPALIGATIILALGFVSLPVALQAVGGVLAAGGLNVLAFTGIAVLLSAWSPKSSYAGAAIFGFLVGADVVAGVLYAISGVGAVLYVSPDSDVVAVARAVFGLDTTPVNAAIAAAVLGAVGVGTLVVAYRRIATMDVVAE
ncbi:MAG TPA: hypothetical protein VGV89_08360 [Thermoplasmata archaeon]|nr:hypothetical protein [Thermoplasmata archaeon]